MTASPSDAKVAVGARVVLTCKTSSSGTTSYKWLLNNQQIRNSPTTNTYTVPTYRAGSQSISCVAIIAGGQSQPSSAHAVLVVGQSDGYYV